MVFHLNRLKVVLAEKGRSNKWLAEELGKGKRLFQNGAQILANLIWLLL